MQQEHLILVHTMALTYFMAAFLKLLKQISMHVQGVANHIHSGVFFFSKECVFGANALVFGEIHLQTFFCS